jgi:hypothetical protein
MGAAGREEYQQAVQDILNLYAAKGGAYGVGDEYGQYNRISLRGVMEEHERLCRKICDEWLHILGKELPSMQMPVSEAELKLNGIFVESFSAWMTNRAREEILFVGAQSDGLLAHLYYHLLPKPIESVLDGRRLACMKSGRVGIVPSQARDGDFVVYLAGSPVAILLRQYFYTSAQDRSQAIVEAFKAKDEGSLPVESRYLKSFTELFETKDVTIKHAKLVGECYVDGVVGWMYNGVHEHKIFALH